jgi:hypothetical protein
LGVSLFQKNSASPKLFLTDQALHKLKDLLTV